MRHWNRLFIVISLILLVLPAADAAAGTFRERLDQTYPLKARGLFSLSNVNGAIEIRTWDRQEVRLEVEKVIEGRDEETTRRAMQAFRIDITAAPDSVRVVAKHPKRADGPLGFFDWLLGSDIEAKASFRVTVPQQVNLDISTVNGKLSIEGVDGRSEVESVNGRIEIRESAGSLEASTVNGGVNATLRRVDDGIEISTVNGSIRLDVPDDIRADLKINTVNGSIRTGLPILIEEKGRRSLAGNINGGGKPIRLKTTNGSVGLNRE